MNLHRFVSTPCKDRPPTRTASDPMIPLKKRGILSPAGPITCSKQLKLSVPSHTLADLSQETLNLGSNSSYVSNIDRHASSACSISSHVSNSLLVDSSAVVEVISESKMSSSKMKRTTEVFRAFSAKSKALWVTGRGVEFSKVPEKNSCHHIVPIEHSMMG